MKLTDIFNKKLRDEKKRAKIYNLPDWVITSEFLNLFPEEEIRNKIYNYITNMNLDIETYNTLLQLYKANKELAMPYIDYNVLIPKEVLNFKDFLNYSSVAECINFQKEYGDIVIPYLKENFDFYRQLLNNKQFIEAVEIEFALKFPQEMLQIMKYYPKALNLECLSMVCDLLKEGKTQQYNNAVEILSIVDIDDIVVELLFKNDFDKTLINDFINNGIFHGVSFLPVMDSSGNTKYRKLINEYQNLLYKRSVDNGNLDEAKVRLWKKLFGGNFNIEQIKDIIDSNVRKTNKIEKILDIAVALEKCTNFSELNNIYIQSNFDSVDFCKELEELYRNNLSDISFHPSENHKKIDKDGICIIDNSTCDLSAFTFLVHGVSARPYSKNFDIASNVINNPNLWIQDSYDGKHGNDFISCSLISEFNLCLFTGDSTSLFLGFDKFDDMALINISKTNSAYNISGIGSEIKRNNNICGPKPMPSELLETYFNNVNNEITIGRRGIKPTYILSILNYQGKSYPINDTMKKWAKEFNIPIVQIDFKIVYEKAVKEFDELIDKIGKQGCTLVDFENISKLVSKMSNYRKDIDYNLFDLFIDVVDKNLNVGTEELLNDCIKIMSKYDINLKNIDFLRNGLEGDTNYKIIEISQRKSILSDKLKLIEERLEALDKKDSLEDPNTGFSM